MTESAPSPRPALLAALLSLLFACAPPAAAPRGTPEAALDGRLARVARLEMTFDASVLPEETRAALGEWIAAGRMLDRIFWEQSDPGAWEERDARLATGDPYDAKVAALLSLHAGRFDRLDAWEPFLGPTPRAPGGGLFPPFLTRGGIDDHLGRHPLDRAALLDPLTVVHDGPKGLQAIPYADAYGVWLRAAADHVRAAAAHAPDEATAAAWVARAEALETGTWQQADRLWVALPPGDLEAVLGPYGREEDRLTGRKLAFEAMVGLLSREETDRVAPFLQARGALAAALVPDPSRELPAASLVVVDELYRGGEAAYGRPPIAGTFPWPGNDAGTRTVLWRNRMEARRGQLLAPLAARAVTGPQASLVTQGGYFTLVLMRELARTLEPADRAQPAAGSAREVLDEVRISARGLEALEWFLRNEALPASLAREHHVTHLADLLAAVRPLDDSPAGPAAVVALNWHRERGAIAFDPDHGTWSVDFDRLQESAAELAAKLHAIGDDEGQALRLLDDYGTAGAEIRALRARTADLPLEVSVTYSVAP